MGKLTESQKCHIRSKLNKLRDPSNIGWIELDQNMTDDRIRDIGQQMARHVHFDPAVRLKVQFAPYKGSDPDAPVFDYIYTGVFNIDYNVGFKGKHIMVISKFVGRHAEVRLCKNVKRVAVLTDKAEYPIIPLATYNIDEFGNTVLSSIDNVESGITVTTTTHLPKKHKKKK